MKTENFKRAKEIGKQAAHPHIELDSYSGKPCSQHFGLTKREYYAGLAMQGFTSNDGWAKTVNPDDWDEYAERLSDASVKIADALLEKLAKENQS